MAKNMIIVHPGEEYLDPLEIGECEAVNQNKDLFNRITDKAKKYISNGDSIYILPTSNHVFFPLREIMCHGIIIPIPKGKCFEYQFMNLKRKLKQKKINDVIITGVQYRACVSTLFNLLSGSLGTEWSEDLSLGYDLDVEDWEKYEKFCNEKIKVKINEGLTDKLHNYDF